MIDLIRDLETEVSLEWSTIKRTPFLQKSIGLLEIVRSVDDIFCLYSYLLTEDAQNDPDCYEYFKTHVNGFYECYEQLAYDEDQIKSPNLFFLSTGFSRQWANSILQKSGCIGYIERYLQLTKHGLFELSKQNDNDYLIKCKLLNTGSEWVETQYQKHILGLKASPSTDEKRISELAPYFDEVLPKRVSIWNEDFIKYDSDELIDEYCLLKAKSICKGMVGNDAFHDDSKFDGISFGTIKEVMIALVASSVKHLNFCLEAIKKYKTRTLNPWNFYTTPLNKYKLVEEICATTGIQADHVSWVIELLTLTKKNLNTHLGSPGSSLPPLIKIEKDWVLRLLAGTLSNPFTYTIRCLKSGFDKDYFNAVNLREEKFRNEFYDLFPDENIIKANKSIELKLNGKACTDIDALLYDLKNKLLLIVQLKWMDDFGTSMKQRKSMADNFYNSSIKWIDKLDEWLKINPVDSLAKYFDTKDLAFEIKDMRMLVLGRHFAHFSDKVTDERATWCSWSQLVYVVHKKGRSLDLPGLLKELDGIQVDKIHFSNLEQEKTYKLTKSSVTISFKSA